MEVYILDGLLRRSQVVDKFESLIWTERWNLIGDFELELKSTLENRSRFLPNTHLAINNSHRVMTVESVEDKTDGEGQEMLSIKGRSLEWILEDRVVKNTMNDLATDPAWILNDTPGNVARAMFDHICRTKALDADDGIPFLQPGTILPLGNIPESTEVIEWEQKPDLLYNAIHKVCDLYDLGFRFVRNFDTSQLYFEIYTGNDRTTKQSVLSPVVFAVGLDNIENTTEFSSIQRSKNVAYVFSETAVVVVYGENIDPDVEGFDRRVIVVNANVDATHPDVPGMLAQAGNEALLEHKAKTLFDGEVNQRMDYVYGVDYDLGDLVEMRNKDGVITQKRVTEQIFVADANGERSYPTLAMGLHLGEDTWLTYGNKTTVWEDFDTEVWADM